MKRKPLLGLIVLIVFGGMVWTGSQAFHKSALDHELLVASAQGNPTAVQSLLERGADPNVTANSISEVTWQHLLNQLLHHKQTRFPICPLSQTLGSPGYVVDANHIAVVRLLLEHGANPNSPPFALRLFDATKSEAPNERLMTLLLEHGLNPNLVDLAGNSLLIYAVCNQNAPRVRVLLARGADVSHRNNAGQSALTGALLEAGHNKVGEILLAAGADVNTPDLQGYSPFQYALIHYCPYAGSMVAHGADVRRPFPAFTSAPRILLHVQGHVALSLAPPCAGATPLMLASQYGSKENLDLVRSIMKQGVDLNAQDAQGHRALYYARWDPIRTLLRQAGAHN